MNIQQLAINNNLQQISQVKHQNGIKNSEQQNQNVSKKNVDEYIHAEPEKSAGIYDENGKIKDSENNENENSTMAVRVNEGKLSEVKFGGMPAGGISANSENESFDSDDELEELEQQQAQLRQQLNTENDENVKAQLRTELQNIENQIMQLKVK